MTNQIEQKIKWKVDYSVEGIRSLAPMFKLIEAYSKEEARLRAITEIKKHHRNEIKIGSIKPYV